MHYMVKPRQKNTSKKIGIHYEEIAKQYLIEKGYTILNMNYHCKLGEVDVIADDGEYLVFVEVKYRKNACYGHPREYVNYQKQQRIIRVAKFYLMMNNLFNQGVRFDVIDILDQDITHIMGAFT